MKTFVSAIALVMAAPVAAQVAPAADRHAQHDHQQNGAGHTKQKMDCCKDGKHKECCEKAKQEGRKMTCCEHEASGKAKGHQGHNH